MDFWSADEDAFDYFGDAEEWELAFEEGGYGDFVGGVEGGGMGASLFHGFARDPEARETAGAGLFEIEALEFGPIESDVFRGEARGVGERVLNGHAHVGGAELRQDGAIDEFDHGVNRGLGMDDDIDLIGAGVEEPACFDDFETLFYLG